MSDLGIKFRDYMLGKNITFVADYIDFRGWHKTNCNHGYALYYDSESGVIVDNSPNRYIAYFYLENDDLEFFKNEFEKFNKLKVFL